MYNTNKPSMAVNYKNMDDKLFAKYVRYKMSLLKPLSHTSLDTTDRDGNEVIILLYKHAVPMVITKGGALNESNQNRNQR